MAATDHFKQKSEDFLNWFQSIPGSTFHENIEIRDLRHQNAGRGIAATADIEANVVLFTIPRQGILCASTSALASEIPSILPDAEALGETDEEDCKDGESMPPRQDSWSSLMLIMIYEYLRGEASMWKPYLDLLPSDFETPMFWSASELAELQASPVVSRVGKAEADRMIRTNILPVIHSHEHVFYGSGGDRLSDEDLSKLSHRMGSIIMAYAFDLEKDSDDSDDAGSEEADGWVEDREGKTLMGMVPMADVLNADAEFNAHINHEEDALAAKSLRPIQAGEEILNYYGPLSNGELLRRYGYTSAKHGRYDVVDLPWTLVVSSLKARLGLDSDEVEKILESLGSDDLEDSFILDRNLDEADSTGRVASGDDGVKELPTELEEQVKAFLKEARKTKPEAIPDKRKRDEIYFAAVYDAVTARLGQYRTSRGEDQALLEAARGRRRMALEVRMGEKALLKAVGDFLMTKMGEEEESGPRAKRPKMET